MIRLYLRITEEHHQAVANELIDRSLVLENDIHHCPKVLVQQSLDLVRRKRR